MNLLNSENFARLFSITYGLKNPIFSINSQLQSGQDARAPRGGTLAHQQANARITPEGQAFAPRLRTRQGG